MYAVKLNTLYITNQISNWSIKGPEFRAPLLALLFQSILVPWLDSLTYLNVNPTTTLDGRCNYIGLVLQLAVYNRLQGGLKCKRYRDS